MSQHDYTALLESHLNGYSQKRQGAGFNNYELRFVCFVEG